MSAVRRTIVRLVEACLQPTNAPLPVEAVLTYALPEGMSERRGVYIASVGKMRFRVNTLTASCEQLDNLPELTASENWTDPEAVVAFCMSVPSWKPVREGVDEGWIGNSWRIERTSMHYRVYDAGPDDLVATVVRPRLVDPNQGGAQDEGPSDNRLEDVGSGRERNLPGTLPLTHFDRNSLPG